MSCGDENYTPTVVCKGNDYNIDLSDVLSGTEAINGATVTFQIYDVDDAAVSGASGTLTIDGTGGDYEGVIDYTVIDLLTVGEEYRVQVTGIDAGNGYNFEFNDRIIIERRGRS